jgi:hypothetical protein
MSPPAVSPPPTSTDKASWTETLPCYAVLILGVATLCFAALLVIRSYSPVLFVDQWEIPRFLISSNGQIPASWFWTQHGEHRIPILKALQLIDLHYFGGRNLLLLTAGFGVQLLHLGFLSWFIVRFGIFPTHATAFLVGAAAFCLFCPTQWEILVFGWGIMYQLAYFAASVAIVCLILYAKSERPRFIACSILAAVIAECTLANGVLLWPVLFVEAYALRLSRRIQALLAAAGVIAIGVYLIGYHSPGGHSNPLESLARPLDVAHYVVVFLNASLLLADPALSGYLALLGALFIAGLCEFVILRPASPALMYCGLMGGYLLVTATITALGRLNFGLEQALSSRYQTPAMLFWWIVLAALVALRKLPVTATVTTIAILLMMTHFRAILDHCTGRSALMETALLAIQMDIKDDQYIRNLYPIPESPIDGYKYLWRRGLALPKTDPTRNLGAPIRSLYNVIAAGTLENHVDTVNTIPGAVLLTGWANQKISSVVLTDPAGVVIGCGVAGLPRPEVPAANAPNSGWHGFARIGEAVSEVEVWAVLPDRRSVCPLAQVALRNNTRAQSSVKPQ